MADMERPVEAEERPSGPLTAMREKFEDGFEWLGLQSARRPWTVIAFALGLCLACSIGFIGFESESRPEKLWVAQGTDAVKDNDYVTGTWSQPPRFNAYLAKADDPLSPAAFQELYRLYLNTTQINVTAESHSSTYPGSWNFARACLKRGSACVTYSPLDLVDYNASLINSLTSAEIQRRVDNASYYKTSWGSTITATDIFGYDSAGNVRVLRGVYVLDSHVIEEDNERVDVVGRPWEAQGIDLYRSDNNPLDTIPFFRRGWSDEFGKAIQSDASIVGIAYVVIMAYLAMVLGRRDPVDCMVGVSFCAIIGVGMAIAASWGLCGAFGARFTPVHNNIPFLLLGLGVDDAFILVTYYQKALKSAKSEEQALVYAVRRGGMSILITSLTDFLAFAIGSTTVLPALSSFCIYAGVGVIFDFIFQITFFMACVSLNSRRARANRRDCCCCISYPRGEPDPEEEEFEPGKSEPRGCFCIGCTNDVMEPTFQRAGETLTKWPARIVVICVYLVLIGLSINGVASIKKNFKLDWFLPEGSYLLQAMEWTNDYFPRTTNVGVYIKDIDYYTRQAGLNAIGNFLTTSSSLITTSSTFWFSAYMSWAATTSPYSAYYTNSSGVETLNSSSVFYDGLDTYLKTNGTRYSSDVQWVNSSNPEQGITASRGACVIRVSEFGSNGRDKYNTMNSLRSDLEAAMNYNDARVFARDFIFWEEYGFIDKELVRNLLISLAVMFFIVYIMIISPMPVLCVSIAIGSTVLDTLGMAYYWGVEVNNVVTIFMLISVGLSVDYSAHIGHAFTEAKGTAAQRVVTAMATTGPPVFNAVFSTFLAVMCLSGAQTYVFEIFFQMFLLTTLLGGFHGLVVLPMLLGLIGGDKPAAQDGKNGARVGNLEMSPLPDSSKPGFAESETDAKGDKRGLEEVKQETNALPVQ